MRLVYNKKERLRMRLLLSIVALAFAITACGRQGAGNVASGDESLAYDYYVKVTGIADGDTFTGVTTDDGEKIRFRIYGIDAPEKKQPFSNKAKQYLSGLIYGKKVGIIVQKKKDRYGRPVVWVYTPDGEDVSSEMLKAGLAWHAKQYDKSEGYAELENMAKQERAGLWSETNPVAPWEYKKKKY